MFHHDFYWWWISIQRGPSVNSNTAQVAASILLPWYVFVCLCYTCYYTLGVFNRTYISVCVLIIGLDLLRLALLSENGLKFFFGDADNGQVFLGELFASAVYV